MIREEIIIRYGMNKVYHQKIFFSINTNKSIPFEITNIRFSKIITVVDSIAIKVTELFQIMQLIRNIVISLTLQHSTRMFLEISMGTAEITI